MSHELETFDDGTAAFASAHKSAWHRLGTVTTEAMTAQEAMELAYLSRWDIQSWTLKAVSPDGTEELIVPEKFANVRRNPKTLRREPLGVVGDDYQIVQNEENADFLDTLVDVTGAKFETAGSMRGGRQTFMTMRAPEGITVAGQDAHDLYFAILNSHDGSSALRVIVTPIRIVCANTQRMALRDAKAKFTVRHTSGVKGRIAEARKALEIMHEYADAFSAEAERLMNEEYALAELRSVVDQVWPKNEDAKTIRAENNREKRWGTIRHLFTEADTQADYRGTKWAAYNAITEYVDHHAPVQAKGADPMSVRAERVVSGTVDRLKTKAYGLIA